jgi:hypothetical protein
MRHVLGDETAIGCLGEDAQETFDGTVLKSSGDRMAMAVDQRDYAKVHVALCDDDLHLLPIPTSPHRADMGRYSIRIAFDQLPSLLMRESASGDEDSTPSPLSQPSHSTIFPTIGAVPSVPSLWYSLTFSLTDKLLTTAVTLEGAFSITKELEDCNPYHMDEADFPD